ncbi:MAG: hypothetical protein EHM28_02095 [Spirochaetaceae bacterium]|nr:MAG: hypothetical protein EHM28_02095 [Spirochaetaceae bacterium]
MANVYGYKTVGQEKVISMKAERNASVSRQAVLVVLDLLNEVIKEILLGGDRCRSCQQVNTR